VGRKRDSAQLPTQTPCYVVSVNFTTYGKANKIAPICKNFPSLESPG